MFDRAFDAFWRDAGRGSCPRAERPADEPRHGASSGGRRRRPSRWPSRSRATRSHRPSRRRALQTWSDAERARAQGLRRVHGRGDGAWRARRWTASSGRPASAGRAAGCAGAGRASTCGARSRAACAPAATSSTLPRRRRRMRPRPLVLLCDVSGSMERYSRMLLHFAHAIGRRHRRVEAFLFSTRLTRDHRRAARAAARRGGGGGRRARCPTGRAAPASARRCASSTSAGRAACCTAARSCC